MGLDRLGGEVIGMDPDVPPLLLLGPESTDENLRGLEYLAGWKHPEGAAAVNASPVMSVPARDTVVILIRCVWTPATAGRALIQMGTVPGVIDAVGNCWSRNVISRGRDTGALGNSDGGLFFGTKETSVNRWLLQGNTDTGSANARALLITANNGVGMAKTATWLVSRSTGTAATNGPIGAGWGEYCGDVSKQLRCFQLGTDGGASMFLPGTALGIFGRNHR